MRVTTIAYRCHSLLNSEIRRDAGLERARLERIVEKQMLIGGSRFLALGLEVLAELEASAVTELEREGVASGINSEISILH